jgi:hypothetical protein
MENFIKPSEFDSISEVQFQLDQFIRVTEMAESLVSSQLIKGALNLNFKAPEDLKIAIYSKNKNDVLIADKFDADEEEKSGIILFDSKFPLIVDELRTFRNAKNPFKIDVDCIANREDSRILYSAKNLSRLIFTVKY